MILFRVVKTFVLVMALSIIFAIVVLLMEKGVQRFVDWAWRQT
jgi:hypothetical protein